MAAPRKVFRIEETPAARLAADSGRDDGRHNGRDGGGDAGPASQHHTEIMQALDALRSAFATPAATSGRPDISGTETGRLTSELNLIAGRLAGGDTSDGADAPDAGTVPLTRVANELLAVTTGTEQATQKILAAAEAIDQLANNLSATLKGKIEQELAQDIRDLVVRIFEACNFQDLIGQRVSKVTTTLKFVEDHITGVLDEIKTMSVRPSSEAAQYLHGPRLSDDNGHVSQTDIDAIFDT
jgi:chemotaxis protein CheZ